MATPSNCLGFPHPIACMLHQVGHARGHPRCQVLPTWRGNLLGHHVSWQLADGGPTSYVGCVFLIFLSKEAVPRERGPGQAPALLSRDAVWRCDAATLHGAVTLRRSMAGATLRRCLALRRCDAGLRRDAATLLGAATLRRWIAARRCDAATLDGGATLRRWIAYATLNWVAGLI